MDMESAFRLLAKSPFRMRFKLTEKEKEYMTRQGWERIRSHAADFVHQKLAPAHPEKDGKQTPMRGHPVFKAMHGCAMCCRSCMEKYWKVPKGTPLSDSQEERIVNFLMEYLHREMPAFSPEE